MAGSEAGHDKEGLWYPAADRGMGSRV